MRVFRFIVFFFFQAEDGIRDLVRSRGLGDVYKRQGLDRPQGRTLSADHDRRNGQCDAPLVSPPQDARPVSYTHLTLPTSDLV